ncbi:MAG: DNA-directed RNA polymerase subunit beta' [Armatimonadota bacterium]
MTDASAFTKIRVSIASPDDIRQWSHGEVKKPETINYRTFKPERDGLFCERIFGPVKDWECHCGRYRKVKYKGIICERCGVEVTRARVRRSRMGHIELASPVCHIWYLKAMPSPLALILDMSARLLEKVIYFASYIVTHVDRSTINQELDNIRDALEEIKENIRKEAEEEVARMRREFNRQVREHGANSQDPWDEATIAEKRAYLERRIQQEYEEAEARIEELIYALSRPNSNACLERIEKRMLINDEEWRAIERLLYQVSRHTGKDYTGLVKAGMGGAAIRDLLKEIDLESLARELRQEIQNTQGQARIRAIKRLEIVEAFINSKNRPEWMILECIPVLPPELRPMVQLDGGRFATSDLNDLYRRIINRNNRLKKIIEIRAPESIVNHEKRLLQEAVDALIDNGRRARPVVGTNGRALKSLSDMLKGKEGRFRKNLLGKRVDYSGRSVIVVGPSLKLHQCGLPKEMVLELFKPFVMKRLVDSEVAQNIKTAKRMIERMRDEVWDALDEVIHEHPVLLNRAPTLHRLGIQAFEPVLVDGKAIQIHPLVCPAYNADFDGDQMAVHVPLSPLAQAEARVLMLSTQNLFSPADGRAIVAPTQDIVLGAYYLTIAKEQEPRGIERIQVNGTWRWLPFRDVEEARLAMEHKLVGLHDPILVRLRRDGKQEVVTTTVGRLIFHEILPEGIAYTDQYLNMVMDKKALANLIVTCFRMHGQERTVKLLDDLKDLGFRYATTSGITIAITDMESPEDRERIMQETMRTVERLNQQYRRGQLTLGERKQRVIQAWQKASEDIGEAIARSIDRFNPLYIITASGARGSTKQLSQLAGMRGLFADSRGNLMEELPIKSNFHEGLSVLEYFVSTHGARKGMSDTALRTADAGYLTRRLVDAAQDVIVRAYDCGTTNGIYIRPVEDLSSLVETVAERIRARTALEDIRDPVTGELLAQTGELISDEDAQRIDAILSDLDTIAEQATDTQALEHFREMQKRGVFVRSPLTCEHHRGVCAKCYGRDMATGKLVEIGTAVGIIAAQSIGEPGTQLTMRTFHTGGVAATYITGGKQSFNTRLQLLEELRRDVGRYEERMRAQAEQGGEVGEEGLPLSAKQFRELMDTYITPAGSLPRVIDLFMATEALKGRAIMSEHAGTVAAIESSQLMRQVILHVPVTVTETGEGLIGEIAAKSEGDPEAPILREGEKITPEHVESLLEAGITEVQVIKVYPVPGRGELKVKVGDTVEPGDALTEGLLQPRELLKLKGVRAVQEYLVQEIQKVYKQQGVDIHDKHIEIIVRQMLKKRRVVDPGDTRFLPGSIVDKFLFEAENERVRRQGGREANAEWVLQSITEAALTTESFLSAASFERTTHVLTEAAVRGKKDDLVGLKENVIIGRLIPAGTGYAAYRDLQPQPLAEGAEILEEAYDPVLHRELEPALLSISEQAELPVVEAGEVLLTGEEELFEEEDILGEEVLDDFGMDVPPITPPREEEDIDPLAFGEE